MCRISWFCFVAFGAVLLIAADSADSSWKNKPIQKWGEEEAKQVLSDSPWVKYASPEEVRDMSPAERRDSGDWDANIGKGVGLAGTGILGPRRAAAAIAAAHEHPQLPPLVIRWESALPVRVAEQKTADTDVPPLDSDGYAIAIYNVDLPEHWNLARELKGISSLKRNNKKDAKPSRVEILHRDDETSTLVYLFPRSVEITRNDGIIEFVAQIGRMFVRVYFNTQEMRLQGEPQLLMP
jgi:hypothetical protein